MATPINAELARLKSRKRTAKASITRFETYMNTIDRETVDVHEISVRIANLEESYKIFSEAQIDIASLDETISAEDLDVETTLIEDKYIKLKVAAEKIIKRKRDITFDGDTLDGTVVEIHDDNDRNNVTFHGRNNMSVNNHIRLPKIELPTFSGDYTDWYGFYDMFNSLIHSNQAINDVQRFHYLKSSLKGKAAEIVASLDMSGANYTNAWSRLKERYDNKRLIMQNHIKAIFDLPAVKKEEGSAIRQLLDGVVKHTRALKALKRPTEQWDDLLVHVITSKLDNRTIREWEGTVETNEIPSFDELTEFLSKRCQMLEAIAKRAQLNTVSRLVGQGKSVTAHASTVSVKCNYCQGEHLLYQCKDFQRLSVPDKAKHVKTKGLCMNCLKGRHLAKDCLSGNCKTCGKRHNSLLHEERNITKDITKSKASLETSDNKEVENKENVICSHSRSEEIATNQILLSTAVVKVKDVDGNYIKARALLDSGSQSSFVSEELVNKLRLKCHNVKIEVKGVNHQVSHALKSVKVSIASHCNSFTAEMQSIVLPKITQNVPAVKVNISHLSIPNNLRLADPQFNVSKPVDLLIGADIFWDLICVGQIKLGKQQPTLQKTLLGWIVAGRVKNGKNESESVLCNLTFMDDLHERVTKFWQIENCFDKEIEGAETTHCEEYFKINHSRNAEGRFVVRLPLKDEIVSKFGNSEDIALKRFKNLEKRLSKDEYLKTKYVEFMKEYLDLGHMKPVSVSYENKIRVFLPHHAVVKQANATTKVRVVFDASSKDSNGISLNDALYKGPVIQSDLFSILLKFRCFRFVMSADIQKMYRQIMIQDDQTCLQTILWRDDVNQPIQRFELITLTYGTKTASFIAVKCLQQLAIYEGKDLPLAAKAILENFYVDDLLTGAQSVSELLNLKNQIIELLRRGGFELHKWVSNADETITRSSGNISSSIELDKDSESKLLGVLWNPSRDTFHFTTPIQMDSNRITKRVILSEVSRLFDPLGLVGPVITFAKILIQSLWACNIGWDDSIPMNVHKSWFLLKSQLSVLEALSIPRAVASGDGIVRIILHGFSDASEQAYGACVYIVAVDSDMNNTSSLLCSKSRVAPLKALSLPRLELCGALLLTRLMEKVMANLNLKVCEKYYWTDSRIVLAWIGSPAKRWQNFVANRVGEIQSSSSPSDWRHVRSADNPADLISRGATPEQLKNSKLWWGGPMWLELSRKQWPSEGGELLSDSIPEKRKEISIAMVSICKPTFDFERFSSLRKLLRSVVYVLRFVYNTRCDKSLRKTNAISAVELKEAQLLIIKQIQETEFEEERLKLEKRQRISKNSKLISLKPFLDDDGLLRVGGRLQNSLMTESFKHPIILPAAHAVTKLIIIDRHERLFHAGVLTTLASVKEEFWPLAAKNAVKKLLRKCVNCCKANPVVTNPIMGHLPEVRTRIARPFLNAGVDYCGPFFVRDRVRRNAKQYKAYVAIFVCMVTKAVHIELVEDMTAEAFIGAVKRLISRRGKIINLYSDNGRNFVGVDRELQQLFEDSNFKKCVQTAAADERIIWHYIPPRAPHFGGLWEAAVRSMKRLLKRNIGNSLLTVGEMNTILSQVEAIMNSRPLVAISDDVNDLAALTPGHFLIGDSLTAYPEPDLRDLPVNKLSRWQHLEKIKQHFWSRWSSEYLTTCHQRTKWKTESNSCCQVGQLVMLKEDESMPMKWILGRILQVHPGADNVVRAVTVKTAKGVYKRPVVKIAVLPCE